MSKTKWLLMVLGLSFALAGVRSAEAQLVKDAPGRDWRAATKTPQLPQAAEVEQLIAKGRFAEAAKRATRLLKDESTPGRDVLLFLRGKASYYANDYDGTTEAFAELRELYGEGRFERESAEFEYAIAQAYLQGRKRSLLGMPILAAYGEGQNIMRSLVERAPFTPMAQEAVMSMATHYVRRRQFDEAQQEFAFLIRNYATSPFMEEAEFNMAYCFFLSNRGVPYDRGVLLEARDTLKFYLEKYPNGTFRAEAEQLAGIVHDRLAEKDYQAADLYQRRGHPDAAAVYLQWIDKQYPKTAAAAKARAAQHTVGTPTNGGEKQ